MVTAGKAQAVGIDGLERLPGLAGPGHRSAAWSGPAAQGQGDSGPFFRHHQFVAGAGGRRPAVGHMAGTLGNRKPAALGTGCGVRGGPESGENGSAPQLMAALRNLVIGMLRLGGVKNIAAALRHYSWKPWETLTLIGLPRNK